MENDGTKPPMHWHSIAEKITAMREQTLRELVKNSLLHKIGNEMLSEDIIESYNKRLTFDLGQLKNLTPAQQDRIRHYGSQAEALLKNKELALFIHHFKFSITDELAGIRGHTQDDNTERVALSNELTGIDNFINSLKRAVYMKNKLGNTEVPEQI